jgi:hypothetical protein
MNDACALSLGPKRAGSEIRSIALSALSFPFCKAPGKLHNI